MTRQEPNPELERLHAASFSWALSCCRRDREEAEEVLQASYLKVLEGRARFDERSSFKTFLFGVIRRTAAERRRRRALHGLWLARWGRGGEGEAPRGTAQEPPGDPPRRPRPPPAPPPPPPPAGVGPPPPQR